MKKYFYTRKNTDQLVMVADKKVKVNPDIMDEYHLDTTKKELEDIHNSSITYYKKKKFILKPRN